MGRKAGHLALGIGKAAGATLTVIAEEFAAPLVPFANICDIVEGAIIKRQRHGPRLRRRRARRRADRQARPCRARGLEDVERDEHGHIRFAEVDLARKVKAEVQGRLGQRGMRVHHHGQERRLRAALRRPDPVRRRVLPRPRLQRRALPGRAAAAAAMVSIQGGRLVPIPFDDLRDPATGKTRVRLVDTTSEGFRVARAYMIRLEAEDFEHAAWVDRLADAARLTPGVFRQRFEPPRSQALREVAQ